MKIFSTAQMREWDAYTIAHEPIASIDLMERAATACYSWIIQYFNSTEHFLIFCGTGNNGGDGLAIARMLASAKKRISVYVLQGNRQSTDFSINLQRLHQQFPDLTFLNPEDVPEIAKDSIIIDALFGTGLTRPLEEQAAKLVKRINASGSRVLSIDVPSGLFTVSSNSNETIVMAADTLTFQTYKRAFMITSNSQYTGKVHVLDIGLHASYYNHTSTLFNSTGINEAKTIYKPRNQFAHKHNFGHALLYAGSKNMMGAAILCAKACIRTGAGLVTVHTEDGTQGVIQASLPEAITSTEKDFNTLSKKKAAIGIGPGIEDSLSNKTLISQLISEWQNGLVIDATGLLLLAGNEAILSRRLHHPAILTPHTGEFDKLFGESTDDFERMGKALNNARTLNCYIVLKGPHTLVACPDGSAYFNTTGNAGMATAGSGDALTGMLTSFLTQGYSEKDACIFGVFLHGLAGDIAAEKMSQEAMIASDIIAHIGDAFKRVHDM